VYTAVDDTLPDAIVPASCAAADTPVVCTFTSPAEYEQPDIAGARLYRTEYDTSAKGIWQFWHLQNEDVPCAVCQSTGGVAVTMQPGSMLCPSGWSVEYNGYLMSSSESTTRAEYVCVDAAAEPAAGGDSAANTFKARLSPVQVRRHVHLRVIDVLDKYPNYAEVSCAVW
jgi:hypothetical protein